MESLSILCIAVAGFLFTNLHLRTRYKFKRASDWAAYLYVVACGVPFFLFAWLITSLLSGLGVLRFAYDYLQAAFNLTELAFNTADLGEKKRVLKFLFAAVLMLASAYALGLLSQRYYALSFDKKVKALSSLIGSNSLELIVFEAHLRAFPVLITLSSGKVYAGIVASDPMLENGRLEYLSLFPLLSGYRVPENQRVKFTTNYYQHYENFIGIDESGLAISDFNIAFPVGEVVSISLFDMETYNQFETQNPLSGD